MYAISPETKAWALRLANNPRSALTKAERISLRHIAELSAATAATADRLENDARSLRYNAHLAYLDGRNAFAKKLNKRADTLSRLARKIVSVGCQHAEG